MSEGRMMPFSDDTGLPQVGGSIMEWSLEDFAHKCRFYLGEEQEKPSPDNGLVAVLCNAVRLAREQVKMAKSNLESRTPTAPPALVETVKKAIECLESFNEGGREPGAGQMALELRVALLSIQSSKV